MAATNLTDEGLTQQGCALEPPERATRHVSVLLQVILDIGRVTSSNGIQTIGGTFSPLAILSAASTEP